MAAFCKKSALRAVPSLLAARAAERPPTVHRTHALCTHAAPQSGGGGGAATVPPVTLADLHTALRPLNDGMASLRSVCSALNENVGALVEVVAGGAVTSQWSRTRVCSLSELAAAMLAHEQGASESSAVVDALCVSLAPDVRAAQAWPRRTRIAALTHTRVQVWRCLHRVAGRLHKSFVELQRFSAAAQPLCDEALELVERLRAPEPDWRSLERLARLWEEGFRAAPQCADESCVSSAVRDFALKMAAAGATSADAVEQHAARLLAEGDGRQRREGPSLAFVVATAQFSGLPLFELDFDGIGGVIYSEDTRKLTVPLIEVKAAPAKGAFLLLKASDHLRNASLTLHRLPHATAASEAARQLRLRAVAACVVCLAAARCKGSPWAGLQRVEVKGIVKLLRPLRPQQLARLRAEHEDVALLLPAAGSVTCILRTEFSVIGDSRTAS